MVGGIHELAVVLLRYSVGRLSERERKVLRYAWTGARLDLRRGPSGSRWQSDFTGCGVRS